MNDDCRKTRDRASDLISGVLSRAEEQAIREHLRTCVSCHKYVQALEQEDASLIDHFAQIDADMATHQARVLQRMDHLCTNQKPNTTSIWRDIMKTRYAKLTTAAAVVALAVITGVLLDKSTTPAYAITDLPAAFEQARVIHLQGWTYFPRHRMPNGKRIPPVEIDNWIDVENGRSRHTGAGLSIEPNGARVTVSETISDGLYTMGVNHTERSVQFYRLSEYQQRLRTHHMARMMSGQLFGDIEQIGDFTLVGQERLDGVGYDIWEREMPTGGKLKLWLSAETGLPRRTQMLDRSDDGRWELQSDYQTIEYNVEIPEGVFATEAPAGYASENTKETAFPHEFGRGGGVGFGGNDYSLQCDTKISFTLSNGCVIMGWSSFDRNAEEQQKSLFSDLVFGGRLPRLPVELHGLKPAESGNDVTYAGYHLTHTSKAGRLIEWTLYVPNGTPPANVKQFGYRALYRFNLDPVPKWNIGLTIEHGIPIETATDFETWVLGAMAELSDDGAAPEHVTYPNVMELAREIRASLHP